MENNEELKFCTECKYMVSKPVYCCPCQHVKTGEELYCSHPNMRKAYNLVTGEPVYYSCQTHRHDSNDDGLTCGRNGLWFETKQPQPKIETFSFEREFSVRVWRCLNNEEINTLDELCQKTKAELRRIPNFGRRSLQEVLAVLTEYGLELKKDSMTDHWY